MARERRRACYSLVSSIKDIVGESFIEDDADDQQKGDRNAMSDSKQKQTKIDTKFERPTETDSKETHTHADTHKDTTHTHTQIHGTQTDTTRAHTHRTHRGRHHTHTHTHTNRTQRGRHIHAHTHTGTDTHAHKEEDTYTHTHTGTDTHAHKETDTGRTNRHADRHQDTHTHSQRSHRCRGHLSNPKGDEVRDLIHVITGKCCNQQLVQIHWSTNLDSKSEVSQCNSADAAAKAISSVLTARLESQNADSRRQVYKQFCVQHDLCWPHGENGSIHGAGLHKCLEAVSVELVHACKMTMNNNLISNRHVKNMP